MSNTPHAILMVEGRQAVWLTGEKGVRHEVAGELDNADRVAAAVRAAGGQVGVPLVAWLVPEPTNPHDQNAVMVWIKGGRVGYLLREDAFFWQQLIREFEHHYRMPVACAAHAELPPEKSRDTSLQIVLWMPPLPWRQAGPQGQTIAEAMSQAAAEPAARSARAARRRQAEAAAQAEQAARILRREIWLGQTEEMLIAARGQPEDRDYKVLQTKIKSTFKYHWKGANRYRLRVFLDDGIVVGWEDKG
jgi:hypothetical protein